MKHQRNLREANETPIVLLVEDDVLLRRTTGEYLRLAGFRVIEAANAVECIAVFAFGKPVDLVFSDVSLSAAMDGVMLARWLHRHHPNIPVMLTSGYGGSTHEAAIELVGDASFLSKPYRQAAVADRLRALLEEARAETF